MYLKISRLYLLAKIYCIFFLSDWGWCPKICILYIEASLNKRMMEESKKQLLRRYIKGECTDKELPEVKALLELPGTEEYLHTLMEEIYHESLVYPPNPQKEDEDERMTRMKAGLVKRIVAEKDGLSEKKIYPFPGSKYLPAIAACALFLLTLGIVWQYRNTNNAGLQIAYLEHTNPKGLPEAFTLPDGSVVHIGAGSTLYYPEEFTGNQRNVKLAGTAFFNVQKDKRKPFIIQTDDIRTEVLGTSFKIDAFHGRPVVVAVATGKVAVSNIAGKQTEQPVALTPGEQVTWDAESGKVRKEKVDIYALQQWISGYIYFDGQPLGLVVEELQRRFDVHISISDPVLAAYKVSSTFTSDQSIQDILEVLGAIAGFSFEATNNQQTFKIYGNH